MKLANVVNAMKDMRRDGSMSAAERFDRTLSAAAEFLEAAIGRTGDRTSSAILLRHDETEQLRFVYPVHLARGNVLPIATDSLAGRVALDAEASVFNAVTDEPHKEFFERIPDRKGTVRTIQKMVAAPLLDPQGVSIGVVEISRTGDTARAAGDDFTDRDAHNLAKCCAAFAPYIHRAWLESEAPEPPRAAATAMA